MDLQAAEKLARNLMREHGITYLGWTFEYDNARRRFGVCRHNRKVIGLSQYLVSINNEATVKDTILHEIAHALAGRGHGHDAYWKSICIRIGAKPERCYDAQKVAQPRGNYEAKCDACNAVYSRIKRVDDTRQRSCKCQSGKPWSQRVLLTYVPVK